MALSQEPESRAALFGGYMYTGTPTCYIIGAGSRGVGYAKMALESPELLRITGVAEPNEARREAFCRAHPGIERSHVCDDWPALLAAASRADFVLIATQDKDHAAPAIAALERGFHVLVEKPMATTPEDCARMHDAATRNGKLLGVCHVLRYTPYTRKIKDLIDSGAIGAVHSINLVEPVGNWHFAHSYVRGNWRRKDESSPVLMAKSCHDFDWLRYVLSGHTKLRDVFCSGSQLEFTKAQKPAEAGDALRCVDCAYASECPYNASSIYTGRAIEAGMDNLTPKAASFPNGALVNGPVLLSDIEDAVRTGPYGRCVYECDNDQPDVVSAIFRGTGVQVTFEMRSLTEDICKREVTICGTKGEIRGDMTTVKLAQFKGRQSALTKETFTPASLTREQTLVSGHWGADWYMLNAFCNAVVTGDASCIASSQESLDSHLAVFSAETSRMTDRVVQL